MNDLTKCTSVRGREFCRYHGKGKTDFEVKALKHYQNAKTKMDKLIERGIFDEESIEAYNHTLMFYYATERGEKEALELIETLPPLESDVVQDRLNKALKFRHESEKDDSEKYTYVFPANRLDEAISRVNTANRKLRRAGINDDFKYETETFYKKHEGVMVKMIKLNLNHPKVSVDGWDFVASVDPVGEDVITRVVPGQDLNGYRPEAMMCDHCGKKRHRKATYLLRNSEGEIKQVGSNCLEPFLGVEPKGLWALSYEIDEQKPLFMGDIPRHSLAAPVRDVVAAALVSSNNGKNYVSSNVAYNFGIQATAELARNVLFPSGKTEIPDYTPYLEEADRIIAATSFEEESDYAKNMKTILSADYVDYKNVGYASSVIAAYNRQQKVHEKKEAKIVSKGFLGEISEKIVPQKLVIEKVFHNEENYGYNPTTSTTLIMRNEKGQRVKWKSSKYLELEEGTSIDATGGVVKDCVDYRGEDQTVLTRVKFNVIDAE